MKKKKNKVFENFYATSSKHVATVRLLLISPPPPPASQTRQKNPNKILSCQFPSNSIWLFSRNKTKLFCRLPSLTKRFLNFFFLYQKIERKCKFLRNSLTLCSFSTFWRRVSRSVVSGFTPSVWTASVTLREGG